MSHYMFPSACSRVHPDRAATVAAAVDMAKTIASKSPVAVQGSKVILNYSRDHSVDEGLEYVVSANVQHRLFLIEFSFTSLLFLLPLQLTWNSAMLQTEDIAKAVQAAMTKEQPVFSKL